MLRLRDIGFAGEAHGLVWQLIVLAIEQAGRVAAAAGNPPGGVFAFHAENARLISMGIIWFHLRHLFLDSVRQQQYRVLERKSIHHTTQTGAAKPGHCQQRRGTQKNAAPQREAALKTRFY